MNERKQDKMDVRKRLLFMKVVSDNQVLLIAVFACVLISVVAGISSYFNDSKKSTPVQRESLDNQKFWKHINEHQCQRTVSESGIWYHCDTGWWLESDIVKIVQNRYPN